MKKYLAFVARLLVRAFFLGTVTWAFFGGPYCWLTVKFQGLLWGLGATLVLGRFFCRSVCPLGIVQSLVGWLRHPKSSVRRVCTRLPETKAQRIVRWSVLAVAGLLAVSGFLGVASMVLPISIYGKAVTLWWPGVVVCAGILLLSACGCGRFWCNWICPFGTLFNLVAKIALRKDKVGAGCGGCMKCFDRRRGILPRQDKDEDTTIRRGETPRLQTTRRETLKGVAVIAVAEKLTDGGYADVSLPGEPDRGGFDILPPGAGDARSFARKCVGCQLCVANCPGRCLKPSLKLTNFGQPVMSFQEGYCLANCVKCSEVCPERALGFVQREQRANVHMGRALWRKDLCVRTTNGDPCTACERKCPVRAIHLVKGFPVVDANACIGCGACEHVCPARPLPAIQVQGFESQRIVNPISEADLLAEMHERLAAGAAVVVARSGVIVAEERGRGLEPLLKLHAAGLLQGAVVLDRVIGRAAAAVCVSGGAKKVFARLAARGAAEMFVARGIPFKAEQTVETILNHEGTDSCPMERAVAGLDEPEKMIEAIRKAMKK